MTTPDLANSPGPFFDKSATPLAVLSSAGAVLRANAAFVTGFSGGDPVGRPLGSFVIPTDRPRVEAALRGANLSSDVPPFLVNTALATRMEVHVTRDSDGAFLIAAIASARSIEEHSLAEREADIARKRASLDVLACVLESAPLILWSADSTPTMLTSEGHGLKRLGIPDGALVGLNALDMYKDAPDVAEGILRALKGEVVRKNTSPIPGVSFDNWMIPMHSGDGVITGVIGLAIDVTDRMEGEQALREKLAVIERQNAMIRELATPIINIWNGVLCLPIIGTVDSVRIATIMETLLQAIVDQGARVAVIDLTGVDIVDTATADHLVRLFRAAQLLGAEGVVCGIRPAVAHTITTLGLGWEGVKTMRSLRQALEWCIATDPELAANH